MSNLFNSITSAASAMNVFQNAMQVVQNDTVNVNTPGYVKQTSNFQALPFDTANSQTGGVAFGTTISSRDLYAEQNVQQQQSAQQYSATIASNLSTLQNAFDLQSSTGVAGSLNSLYTSFSQLAVSPNDPQYQASVLNAAQNLASAFNVTANALSGARQTARSSIDTTVTNINSLVADLQKVNVAIQRNPAGANDPSLEARIYTDLEALSQYASISASRAPDGTVSVYLNGQRGLLTGTNQQTLKAVDKTVAGINTVAIEDNSGADVSNSVNSGQLGGLIQVYNNTLPGYQANLDKLAQAVADNFSSLYTISAGQGASAGISVPTGTTTADVPSADALAISKSQNDPVSGLGGASYTQYYAALASQIGRDITDKQNDSATQSSLLAQAQTLRTQSSGVSLNEEAARLEQYQQSYEATSKLISVVANMMDSVINLID